MSTSNLPESKYLQPISRYDANIVGTVAPESLLSTPQDTGTPPLEPLCPSYAPGKVSSWRMVPEDKFSTLQDYDPHPLDLASEFLEEAVATMKARAALRDKPQGERSMEAIVAGFNGATGHSISEEDGWLFMVLLKAVRGRQGFYNKDDFVDGAAYFGLMGESASKNMPRKKQE